MNYVIILIPAVILILVGVFLYSELALKKWVCKEGQCERSLGGTYDTQEQCQQNCAASVSNFLRGSGMTDPVHTCNYDRVS
jgi:hypothetical protein